MLQILYFQILSEQKSYFQGCHIGYIKQIMDILMVNGLVIAKRIIRAIFGAPLNAMAPLLKDLIWRLWRKQYGPTQMICPNS